MTASGLRMIKLPAQARQFYLNRINDSVLSSKDQRATTSINFASNLGTTKDLKQDLAIINEKRAVMNQTQQLRP